MIKGSDHGNMKYNHKGQTSRKKKQQEIAVAVTKMGHF